MNMRYGLMMCAVCAVALAGCSKGQKEKLGLVKTAPDEFAVVTRAPLSVPPEYTLRPPSPGMARPMEQSTNEQARQTLFGVSDVDPEQKETVSDSFMGKLGADEADSNIRARLDAENKTYVQENQPVAEKLLFWRDDKVVKGDVLDAKEEYERLNEEGQMAPSSAPAVEGDDEQ